MDILLNVVVLVVVMVGCRRFFSDCVGTRGLSSITRRPVIEGERQKNRPAGQRCPDKLELLRKGLWRFGYRIGTYNQFGRDKTSEGESKSSGDGQF